MRQDQNRHRESEWAELDLLVDEACSALADPGRRSSRQAEPELERGDAPVEAASEAEIGAEIGVLLARVSEPRALLERLLAAFPEQAVAGAEPAADGDEEPDEENPDA